MDTLKHIPNKCRIVTFKEVYDTVNSLDHKGLLELHLDAHVAQANDLI